MFWSVSVFVASYAFFASFFAFFRKKTVKRMSCFLALSRPGTFGKGFPSGSAYILVNLSRVARDRLFGEVAITKTVIAKQKKETGKLVRV